MHRAFFGLLTITLVGAALASAEARIWTDRTGRQLDAEYIGFSDGKVEIKRASDGKTFHVPIERFSDADQEFVRSQTKAKAVDKHAPDDGRTAGPKPDKRQAGDSAQLRTDFFPTEKDFRKPKVGTASFFSRKEISS
jgi:hypothetical protein